MSETELAVEMENKEIQEALSELGKLEKGFAGVELDHLRRKEFDLKPLYAKRTEILQKIPDFWPTVFLNAPQDIVQHYSERDLEFLASIRSFSVERYQIKSHDSGEPRSLRFIFEFAPNELFTDTKLIKEFEYVSNSDGAGDLISTPVPIKWKSKKKDLTDGLLDAAVDLYRAEQSMTLKKSGKSVAMVDREGLWQHEKLRELIEKVEESAEEPSIALWFGFRGAVARDQESKSAGANVFPAGEEVAISLAEDLWSDAIDYFMRTDQDDGPDLADLDDADEDSSEDDSDNAPALVSAGGANVDRPAKKRRTG
ncbi:hypothetical protein DV738_g3581, partial [Chaetothyriales sp. CBS 135597]